MSFTSPSFLILLHASSKLFPWLPFLHDCLLSVVPSSVLLASSLGILRCSTTVATNYEENTESFWISVAPVVLAYSQVVSTFWSSSAYWIFVILLPHSLSPLSPNCKISTSSTSGKGQRADERVWSGDISKEDETHIEGLVQVCWAMVVDMQVLYVVLLWVQILVLSIFSMDRVKRLVAANVVLRSRLAAYDIARNFPCSREELPLLGPDEKPINDNVIFTTD